MENEDKIEWLKELGSVMFGSHWKPALAEQLGINDRSVRQWANGERTIPDSVIRGLLSQAHDRANAIKRKAERVAKDARRAEGYQRIIYCPEMKISEVRPDLYTENRAWFDVEGQLYALNENGVVTDIHGNEKTWYESSVLPDGITVSDLENAKQNHED